MPEPHGRQIAHFRYVVRQDVRASFSRDRAFRFKLDIPYRPENGRDQTVAIVMKNPSSADEYNADTTIRRVEEYVHRNFQSAARLTVLNLFAYRATDPRNVEVARRLSGLDSIVGDGNDAAIAATVDASDDVILGWGARSGIDQRDYEKRVRQVAGILHPHRRKLWHVSDLTIDAHPRHALQWGYASPKRQLPSIWTWWPSAGSAA